MPKRASCGRLRGPHRRVPRKGARKKPRPQAFDHLLVQRLKGQAIVAFKVDLSLARAATMTSMKIHGSAWLPSCKETVAAFGRQSICHSGSLRCSRCSLVIFPGSRTLFEGQKRTSGQLLGAFFVRKLPQVTSGSTSFATPRQPLGDRGEPN